ncbi:MAG: 37S ribosomal protein S22 [Pleopsidium flavum]|nr:MAG: 37S ribosomal protein S22 [Pleopsidium flavum]
MEEVVRLTRQTFGETLPENLLSSEEYGIYERLYGRPLRATSPEDVRLLQDSVEDDENGGIEGARNVLLRETPEGNLEAMDYDPGDSSGSAGAVGLDSEAMTDEAGGNAQIDILRRLNQYGDSALDSELVQEEQDVSEEAEEQSEQISLDEFDEGNDDYEAEEAFEDMDSDSEDAEGMSSHPYTVAGKFSTFPTTLQLPKEAFTNPITSLLADFSNKHLSEVAHRTFGGPGLPYSTSTPISKRHLEQKPLALEASQSKMGQMEANSYMAAIMPGAYTAVMSTLVEVRKRLGSDWIEGLLRKGGGPRVLDAGSGGAGVVAWREVLKAEMERSRPEGSDKPVYMGMATVVTGSSALRHRSSRLLDNTTFLPRLPDYVHVRNTPTLDDDAPPPQRKEYDVILAPHTLWPLKEDYMRKQNVQNLWSLLNPKGGVLILIEKGLPRGFEMIAGAREMLLDNYISSPGSSKYENELQSQADERFTKKETGMIIAPCTNHTKCPMYLTPGLSKGRKDFCYFKQRFIRPPYLQRILGAKDRNHEDVQFSYVAVRRGRDERDSNNLVQGEQATDAAFVGYEEPEQSLPNLIQNVASPADPLINTLGLPRAILPPIKRRGHVTLDLCTPAGRIERWTIPRSFSKQAYRDARKSQWGDLWALGAKTRVPRNIRLGRSAASKKPKGKNVFEIEIGEQGMEGVKHVTGGRVKYEKRTKKGRKEKKQKKITLDDF